MAENSLKDKLRQAQVTGDLKLGSGDLSGGAAAEAESAAPAFQEVTGDVSVPVSELAGRDPLMNSGVGASVSESVDASSNKSATSIPGNLLTANISSLETVTITDEDRSAFLDTLISGERYCRRFSLFNGKVQGIIRCRSALESEGIATWVAANLNTNKYPTAMAYAVDLRNALMAAQIKRLNGTEFTELKTPLFRTQDGSTEVLPGWLEQAEYWGRQPEAIVGALYEELRLFERKYWTMIENASNQDFWSPVGST